MADREGNVSPGYEVQLVPAQPGGVTALNATSVATYPAAGQPAMGSAVGGAGVPAWPSNPQLLMMPQPSVIVVTVEAKKDGEKNNKGSEVFKRL